MPNFERWWPETIAFDYYTEDKEYLDVLVNKCYEIQKSVKKGGEFWESDVYNTMMKHDLRKEPVFNKIIKWIDNSVYDYLADLGLPFAKNNVEPELSWFNIYKRGDYQEYHHHAGCIASAIFILKSGGNTKINFEKPFQEMIFSETPTEIQYESEDAKLIIFRSHVKHSVSRHDFDTDRVSLAFNYRRTYDRHNT